MIKEANSEWSDYQHEKPVGIFASLLVRIVVDFVLEVMLVIVIVWEGGGYFHTFVIIGIVICNPPFDVFHIRILKELLWANWPIRSARYHHLVLVKTGVPD